MAVERLNFQEQKKYDSIMGGLMTKCKHCGHTVSISAQVDHILCSWCGNYIFKTPQDEFRFRYNEKKKRFCK